MSRIKAEDEPLQDSEILRYFIKLYKPVAKGSYYVHTTATCDYSKDQDPDLYLFDHIQEHGYGLHYLDRDIMVCLEELGIDKPIAIRTIKITLGN